MKSGGNHFGYVNQSVHPPLFIVIPPRIYSCLLCWWKVWGWVSCIAPALQMYMNRISCVNKSMTIQYVMLPGVHSCYHVWSAMVSHDSCYDVTWTGGVGGRLHGKSSIWAEPAEFTSSWRGSRKEGPAGAKTQAYNVTWRFSVKLSPTGLTQHQLGLASWVVVRFQPALRAGKAG